jgi:hypothetical protein
MKRLKVYATYTLLVSVLAFVLHYAWEFIQCSLFIHLSNPATPVGMILPALGDVVLTWVAQLAVAAVSGRWLWPKQRWPAWIWGTLILTALILSVSFEVFALSTDRWAYTDAQPIVPGTTIGLTPVLQLLLLFPLTFALAGWLLRALDQK